MYHHHIPPPKKSFITTQLVSLINSQIHVLCSNSSSFNFTPNCQVSCKIYNMYTEPNMKFNLAAMKKHHEICQNFYGSFCFYKLLKTFVIKSKEMFMDRWMDGLMDNMKPIGTQTYINGFMLYKSIDAVKTRIENQVHKNHTKIDL